MPLPKPKKDEKHQDFVQRCASDTTMNNEYPDAKQRMAVCLNQSKSSLLEQVCEIIDYDPDTCLVTSENLYVPSESEYVCFGEETEDYDISAIAKYVYMDPVSREYFYFQRPAVEKKNNRTLVFVGKAAEYQGRKVKLSKPFRTPSGPKKFSVYVKNEKGNIVKVNFGDPNMKIKKNIPARRKSFRARHNCDNPGPKWKARYWSCKAW